MNQYEQLHERLKTCGGFETSLIHAWFNADGTNKARLEQAFKNTPFDLNPKNS